MCASLCMPLGTHFIARGAAFDPHGPACLNPEAWAIVDSSTENQTDLVEQADQL